MRLDRSWAGVLVESGGGRREVAFWEGVRENPEKIVLADVREPRAREYDE